MKFAVGSGNTAWQLDFPENIVDTANLLNLPPQNKLQFKGSGTELYIGFSALFGLPWGKFGGGFESSRLTIDSLVEEVNGQKIMASYHEDWISFNRFYIEYESLPIPLQEKNDLYLNIDVLMGTYILTPIDLNIVAKSNVFLMLGPQLELKLERWVSASIGASYEFRYFNYKEYFGASEWVYHNYLHSFNIRMGLKFRVYHSKSERQEPPLQRVE